MAENLGNARRKARSPIVVQVIWTRRAAADVVAIRSYIGQFNPLAAQRMALRLIAAGESLAIYPERGRPAAGGRRELATVPPYLIRYRTRGETLEIITVRHGARRPV
ncbi:MAG: type II toxin-antitoxin system RelE/ParE family toxin [Caulobacteraceae bacterium]